MPFSVDVINPLGGLDLDTDLAKVKNGDYVDAKNIQHISEGGQTTYSIENSLGNTLRFRIPETVTQSKKYQITIQTSAGTPREITFYQTNGNTWFTVNWTDDAVWATSYDNFSAALTAAVAAAVPLSFGTITSSNPYAIYDENAAYKYTIVSTHATNDTPLLIIQEQWVTNTLIDANIIGSYDLLGDLFIWSTQQTNMPTRLSVTITGATNPDSPNPIVLKTSGAHGVNAGQEIVVEGVVGQTGANGKWIAFPVTFNTITLYNSLGVAPYVSGGTILTHPSAVGEIGVAVYDANTDVTTYTTLIKSKELNFRTPKQVDTYCEANNFQKSLYWTDDYNVPRVLYYRGAYVANGAINYFNPEGLYSYGSVDIETKLVVTNEGIGATFTGQVQGGGGVKSGNWRYAWRLVTATFDATNWTELSNSVNVYLSDNSSDPQKICGDDAGVTTSKINNFSLTNLPVGVFQYVEMAGVNYAGGAIVGSVLKRVALTSETMVISHTGTESNVTNLDVTTLNQFSFSIAAAKNIDAIDNRLVLSNLTATQRVDFSDFAASFTHSLLQQGIDDIGLYSTGNAFGEYQDPNSVYNYAGYMLNDTYRFGVRFRMKLTGALTDVFWIDDIRFDDSAININPLDNRRVAGLPSMNLTQTGASGNVLVPYVRFSNINLDYMIGGVKVLDLVESIHFERAERVKEVLVSGVVAMTVTGVCLGTGYGPAGVRHGEYTEISGYSNNHNVYPDAFTAERKVAKLYAPDLHFGETALSFILGDEIKNFGSPEAVAQDDPSTGAIPSGFSEYNGFFTTAVITDALTSGTQAVDHASPFILPVSGFSYSQELNENPAAAGSFWQIRSGFVVETTNNLVTGGANPDYGLYNAQYFRGRAYTSADDNKYGNRAESIYIPVGSVYDIGTTAGVVTQDVFGGDVFTQKTYLQHRASGQFAPVTGGGGGIGYYSQNTVNAQMMRKYDNTTPSWDFPMNVTLPAWLVSTTLGDPLATYNEGYNLVNGVNENVGFDSSLPDQTDLPTQIRYSDLKPQNSVMDNFRVFLPLNFKDMPMTFGEITHHANYNGELFTWQPRMVQRQYFNTRGTMQVGGGANTDVLIGDGSVFARDGQMITRIGTYHKWSVIKGKSAQGNDVMYWINTELKKAMRLGYDGSISISDIHGMRSFLAHNLTWVADGDTPAAGEGICGVWDDRYSEAIWTVRGKREIGTDWNAIIAYPTGSIVKYAPSGFSTFEQTGEFYVSIQDTNTGNNPELTQYWTLIPHTGSAVINGITYNGIDYYNEYTIAYNEQKNKFTTPYTFKPKIYLKWTDTFLTPRPITDTGNVYEHRLGRYCIWYDQDGVYQAEDGYIELLFNNDEKLIKQFFALLINSEIQPSRIEFRTKNQETFIVNSDLDMEQDIDFWMAPIKNDILTSSTGAANNEDTSDLFGQWVKIKIFFAADAYQKITVAELKFSATSRTYNK